MTTIQKFQMYALSRMEQRYILGGGGASAKCANGTTVTCSGGSQCTAEDEGSGKEGGCACWSPNSPSMDIKPCPQL
jgi:hypothetical protein